MYNLIKFILFVFFKLICRCSISGQENIPPQGGVMIAANHISLWDPPLLGTFVPRPIHFMAKEELFANPVLSWLITGLNAFPVRRGAADRTAIKKAISLLADDRCLGLFPEGTRGSNGILGPAQPGLAMIAAKSGAAVVPTAIFRTDSWLPRFEVRFGKPVIAEGKMDKVQSEVFSRRIMTEIGLLLEAAGQRF